MNQERIAILVAHLRKPETAAHFKFTAWLTRDNVFAGTAAYRDLVKQPIAEALREYGTSACIAGWAVALFAPGVSLKKAPTTSSYMCLGEFAADLLEIPHGDAIDLFSPKDNGVIMPLVTPKIAADTLEHYAATGEIKWPSSVLYTDIIGNTY